MVIGYMGLEMGSDTKRKVLVVILIIALAGVIWLALYYHRYFKYQLMIGNDYSDVETLKVKTVSGNQIVRPDRGYFNAERKEAQLIFTIPKSLHNIDDRQLIIYIDGIKQESWGTCNHASLFIRQESILFYDLASFEIIRFEYKGAVLEFYRE